MADAASTRSLETGQLAPFGRAYEFDVVSSLLKRSAAALGPKSSSSKNRRTSTSAGWPSPAGFGKRFVHSIASSRDLTRIVV
jgi:hypothetical protein